MEAAEHHLHPELETLVTTGILHPSSSAFVPAFQALRTTSVANLYGLRQFPVDLLATTDFVRTIKDPAGSTNTPSLLDSFQRPVQWILSVPDSSGNIKILVILSPHEANKLISSIREHAKVTLHLFSPRTNFNYESLDQLDLYNVGRNFVLDSVPRSLTMQLNLFAGTLYLGSYEEYNELCTMLGLRSRNLGQGQQFTADGFITPPAGTWGLRDTPVPFFRALLLRIRRDGQKGPESTHIGKMLIGVMLEEADFRRDVQMREIEDEDEDSLFVQ